jgi:hypothetical protein
VTTLKLAAALRAALMLLVGAWAISSLTLPYGWDQGCFAYVADVILRGGMPYRDAWDFKGPLTYAPFVALQALFGPGMWPVRVLDLVVLAVGAWSCVTLLTRFTSRTTGVVTALFLVWSWASFGNWYTAQPDGWVACGLLLVVSRLFTAAPPSTRSVMASAGLIGCFASIKPTHAGALVLVLVALWPASRAGWRHAMAQGLAALLAFAVPIAAMVGWLSIHGVLSEAWDVHVRFNVERLATDPTLQLSPGALIRATWGLLTANSKEAVAAPFALFGASMLLRKEPRAGVGVLAWFAFAVASVVAQRKFSPENYTWHVFYVPLAVLVGAGFGELWQRARSPGAGEGGLAALLLALVILGHRMSHVPLSQISRFAQLATGRVTLQQYRQSFDESVPWLDGASAASVGFGVARDVRVASWLSEHTSPGQRVFVWSDPLVNHLAERPAIGPITIAHAFSVWGLEDRRRRYQQTFIQQLASPEAVYFGVPRRDLAMGSDPWNLPTHFPELLEALRRDWVAEAEVDEVVLYRHRR